MKKIFCKKNQSTKIISSFAVAYPTPFYVTFTSPNQEKISGTFCEKPYFWIFKKTPIEGELKEKMQFFRNWSSSIYSVSIKPDCDVIAHVN